MSLLHPRTHDVLLSAWRENRLAAVHIDMQYGFDIDGWVVQAVGKLSRAMRSLSVSNIWVAYSDATREKPLVITDVKGIGCAGLPRGRIRSGMGTVHDDAAVTKYHDSAFFAPDWPLHQVLQARGKDTILVSGVNDYYCVGETIQDGILSDKYNIIAVGDCINLTEQNTNGYQNYARWIAQETVNRDGYMKTYKLPVKQIQAQYRSRFHIATAPLILDALAQEKGPS